MLTPIRTRSRRALLAAVPAAVAALALPGAAQASSVSLSQGVLAYFQSTDQPNSVVARNVGDRVQIENSTGISTFPSVCRRNSAEVISCPAGFVSIRAFLGNGNDFYTSNTHVPTEVFGLNGNDTYAGAVHGLINKVDFRGGAGSDTVSYALASRGIRVTKNEAADDGRPGLDQDNIRNDVERIVGSPHRDILTGNDLPETELYFPGLGDDVVVGNGGPDSVLADRTADGADTIGGGPGVDRVSYTNRTQPVTITPGHFSPGTNFADDGEAGEGDNVDGAVEVLIGGQAGDKINVRPGATTAFSMFGGAGVDTLVSAEGPDQLHGGSGADTLLANGGDDQINAADGEGDTIGCSFGIDTAIIDRLDDFSNCENRTTVGKLRLAPRVVEADAGGTARLELSWRHPRAWKQLRTIKLRLTRDGESVGEVTIRPRSERIAADGAVGLVRRATRVSTEGKAVSARLSLRLDESLAGETLTADVEATDMRGRRQIERDAGTIRVAR